MKTLVFVRARRLTELLVDTVHERLRGRRLAHLCSKVDSYRAGPAVNPKTLKPLFLRCHFQ